MARNDELNLEDIDDDDVEAPKQLREYAKRQATKAAKVGELEREVAFLRAGIDTSTRKGQAFAATYEGDITDTQAIVADAMDFDASIVRGSTPATATTTTATNENTTSSGETGTEVESQTQPSGSTERTALANGAVASGSAVEDITTSSMTTAREAMERGAGQDEAIGSMIADRARGAAEGKISVLDSNGRRVML